MVASLEGARSGGEDLDEASRCAKQHAEDDDPVLVIVAVRPRAGKQADEASGRHSKRHLDHAFGLGEVAQAAAGGVGRFVGVVRHGCFIIAQAVGPALVWKGEGPTIV